MKLGVLRPGDPGVFRSLLLPSTADALAAGEPVTVLTLTQERTAIGAAAGYLENGRFQLSSLYVAPDYRRRGGGRMLLKGLFRALEGYASGVELRFTVTEEEHRTLLPFLEAMGFAREPDAGESLCLTTLGSVGETPFFANAGTTAGTPFSQLRDGTLSLAEKAAVMAGAPIPEGGLLADTVDREISVARIKDGGVEAYVVFDTAWPDGLTLSAVWCRDPKALPMLLRSAVARAREKYPPETKVAVQAVNSASAALLRELLPSAETVAHTYYCSLRTKN